MNVLTYRSCFYHVYDKIEPSIVVIDSTGDWDLFHGRAQLFFTWPLYIVSTPKGRGEVGREPMKINKELWGRRCGFCSNCWVLLRKCISNHETIISKLPSFKVIRASNCFTIDVWIINCWLSTVYFLFLTFLLVFFCISFYTSSVVFWHVIFLE